MALIIIQNGLISPLKNKNHFTGFLHTLTGSYPIIPDSRSICLIPQRYILQLIHAAWLLGKVSNALQYILWTNFWYFSTAKWYLFVHTKVTLILHSGKMASPPPLQCPLPCIPLGLDAILEPFSHNAPESTHNLKPTVPLVCGRIFDDQAEFPFMWSY